MGKLERIISREHGYLTSETINDLKDVMGQNFKVVVKTYENGRFKVSIKDFENLGEEIMDDIREVFIDSETYNSLMEMIG